jgi:hypothetical protein
MGAAAPEAVDVADHLQMWPSDRHRDKSPPRPVPYSYIYYK